MMNELRISKIELLNNIEYETLYGKVDAFLIEKLIQATYNKNIERY